MGRIAFVAVVAIAIVAVVAVGALGLGWFKEGVAAIPYKGSNDALAAQIEATKAAETSKGVENSGATTTAHEMLMRIDKAEILKNINPLDKAVLVNVSFYPDKEKKEALEILLPEVNKYIATMIADLESTTTVSDSARLLAMNNIRLQLMAAGIDVPNSLTERIKKYEELSIVEKQNASKIPLHPEVDTTKK